MLREKIEMYPNVSLRKLAEAINVSYPTILKASKKPVAGKPYDPTVWNFDALDELVAKKEVNLDDLNWEAMNTKTTKATLIKDHSAFNVGDKVYLRKHATIPYNIIYKTETHIVLILEGTQEPIAWNLNTFMLQGPSFNPRVEKIDTDSNSSIDTESVAE